MKLEIRKRNKKVILKFYVKKKDIKPSLLIGIINIDIKFQKSIDKLLESMSVFIMNRTVDQRNKNKDNETTPINFNHLIIKVH